MYSHHIEDMAKLVADAVYGMHSDPSHGEIEDAAKSALEKYWADKLALTWTVDDVKEVCVGITDEQAVEILQFALRHHDATLGVTWDTFEAAAYALNIKHSGPDEGD
jgi:hypothetical protein